MGRQAIRTLLSPSLVTIHSIFDSEGRRIAEYDEASGTLIREYVWNGWDPIAVIEGGQVYFVRADHIGRPVFATNTSGTQVWSASYLPFGGVHTATGSLPANRFPGQWFQAESGLHQNWMRDYDPTTGRYIQADPLGLIDGASVYGYVGQSPMMFADVRGEQYRHVSGHTIQCGKCTIRIDKTYDERRGWTRHLHWKCRGSEGACGEDGEESHGGSWADAPPEVQKCAIANGFRPSAKGTKPLSGLADLALLGIGAWLISPGFGLSSAVGSAAILPK